MMLNKLSINVAMLFIFVCMNTNAQTEFKNADIENISNSKALMLDTSF
jgi:hypothetical protein